MRRSFLLLLALSTSATALGQITTVTLNDNSQLYSGTSLASYFGGFHQQACQSSTGEYNPFSLMWAPTQIGATEAVFGSTDSSCPTPGGDGGTAGYNLSPEFTGTEEQLTVNTTTLLEGMLGGSACTSGGSGQIYLCIVETVPPTVGYGYPTSSYSLPWYVIVPYDMNPPAAPSNVQLTSNDSDLDVSITFNYVSPLTDTVGDDPDHFIVYFQPDDAFRPTAFGQCTVDGGVTVSTPSDFTGWKTYQTPTPNASPMTVSLTGLTNGRCYDVAVEAFYSDGTPGTPSTVQTAAPIEIWDYWRLYHSAGGADAGGAHCQSAGGTLVPLALLLVALFWLSQRRRAR
ncbi:MAG: hypothetical protein ACYDCL_18065 [Myxococcales bacterium]